MRKATLVLATSVAFLLFVVPNSYAGIKKKVQLPTSQSVANGSGVPVKSGNTLSIPGELQQEYIPADNFSRSTPIKVLPTIDYSIPRTINAVKDGLRLNLGDIALTATIAGLIAGVGWIIDNSTPVPILKKPSPTNYESQPVNIYGSGFRPLQCGFGSTLAPGIYVEDSQSPVFYKIFTLPGSPGSGWAYVNNCDTFGWATKEVPGGYAGLPQNSPQPVTDADFSTIDAYVNAQNADWLRDLLRDACSGSIAPDRCFEDLKDNVSLSGPSTVNGPSTFTTTSSPSGTATKETKTTFQITYGSDYFVYAPTTITTTVNPDGTTEVETEEPAPEEEPTEEELDSTIGDPYAPVVDKYNDIAGGVGDLEGNMSFISYGPWYSFGGACSPISLNLPVMGFYTIDHCPYVIDWIRPTLGFLFAVWTWLHCFSLWRETVQNARPI